MTLQEELRRGIDLHASKAVLYEKQNVLNEQARVKMVQDSKKVHDSRYVTVYLDQTSGSDDSATPNAASTPLKTFQKAFDTIGSNAAGRVILLADYQFSEGEAAVLPMNAKLQIYGNDLTNLPRVKPKASYYTDVNTGNKVLNYKAFSLHRGGSTSSHISFINLGLDFPTLDEAIANYSSIHQSLSAIVQGAYGNPHQASLLDVQFYNCEFNYPANGYGSAVGIGHKTVALSVITATVTNQSMSGRWVSDVPAGTQTADQHNVISNLGTL